MTESCKSQLWSTLWAVRGERSSHPCCELGAHTACTAQNGAACISKRTDCLLHRTVGFLHNGLVLLAASAVVLLVNFLDLHTIGATICVLGLQHI